MNDFQELKYGDRRQDWHQTSTEVGHHYRPGYYFPDTEFTVSIASFLHFYLEKTKQLYTSI